MIFKPVECIEYQKNKQEGKLFRIVLKVVFISICKLPTFLFTFHQTFFKYLAFFQTFRFALYHFIFLKAEFFHVNLCFQK